MLHCHSHLEKRWGFGSDLKQPCSAMPAMQALSASDNPAWLSGLCIDINLLQK